MFFFNLPEKAYLEQTAYLHLETTRLQEVFFSKTNSVFTGKNMLDAPASNICAFLYRSTCVLQLT
jgi:hypothetical protein